MNKKNTWISSLTVIIAMIIMICSFFGSVRGSLDLPTSFGLTLTFSLILFCLGIIFAGESVRSEILAITVLLSGILLFGGLLSLTDLMSGLPKAVFRWHSVLFALAMFFIPLMTKVFAKDRKWSADKQKAYNKFIFYLSAGIIVLWILSYLPVALISWLYPPVIALIFISCAMSLLIVERMFCSFMRTARYFGLVPLIVFGMSFLNIFNGPYAMSLRWPLLIALCLVIGFDVFMNMIMTYDPDEMLSDLHAEDL